MLTWLILTGPVTYIITSINLITSILRHITPKTELCIHALTNTRYSDAANLASLTCLHCHDLQQARHNHYVLTTHTALLLTFSYILLW